MKSAPYSKLKLYEVWGKSKSTRRFRKVCVSHGSTALAAARRLLMQKLMDRMK